MSLEKLASIVAKMSKHSTGTRDQATATGRALRSQGVFATIWHVAGPKSGPKSVYAVRVPS